MDEFTKSMIAAGIGGALTIVGGIISKLLDLWLAGVNDKRSFLRSRREQVSAEIEALKTDIGKFYMLSINWMAHSAKVENYVALFSKEHEVLGRCAKFPKISAAAIDAVYYCRLVESAESGRGGDPISAKKELATKYRAFIDACDEYIKRLP
jgi:hypothetical protein